MLPLKRKGEKLGYSTSVFIFCFVGGYLFTTLHIPLAFREGDIRIHRDFSDCGWTRVISLQTFFVIFDFTDCLFSCFGSSDLLGTRFPAASKKAMCASPVFQRCFLSKHFTGVILFCAATVATYTTTASNGWDVIKMGVGGTRSETRYDTI